MTFDDIDYWVALLGTSAIASGCFVYDAENRLTEVRVGEPNAPCGRLRLAIWYDALGRRILSETYDASGDPVKTTRHIYDGLATIVEYECAGAAAPVGEPCGCGSNDPNACGPGSQPALAREFLWGDRFPEPLVLIDHTDAGDVPAGLAENLYYVHDALGSVVGLTNDPAALAALDPNLPGGGGGGGGSGGGGGGGGSGGGGVGGTTGILPALVERYDYDPYGATYIACRDPSTYDSAAETRDPGLLTDPAAWQPCDASRFGNPFLWTAQRYDPGVGLYHFLFRTYSPTLGRWMQRDPLGYVDAVSLIQYVASNPASLHDPTGLCSRSPNSAGGTEPPAPPSQPATQPGQAPATQPSGPLPTPCTSLMDAIRDAILALDSDIPDNGRLDKARAAIATVHDKLLLLFVIAGKESTFGKYKNEKAPDTEAKGTFGIRKTTADDLQDRVARRFTNSKGIPILEEGERLSDQRLDDRTAAYMAYLNLLDKVASSRNDVGRGLDRYGTGVGTGYGASLVKGMNAVNRVCRGISLLECFKSKCSEVMNAVDRAVHP
ncbi:MAG: RHS repeat-associated core domain-containing protein [Phycisphaerales bacterium]|nr:RHS repeat-associated core domain-containing protein [Phycisphaerales bacterium]